MLLTLAGTWAFHRSEVGLMYAAANDITSVVWAFAVPYMFGMCAQLDNNGQLTVLGGFCSKMGLATGPLLAGRLLVHDDYGLLINATVAVLIACALSCCLRRAASISHDSRAARDLRPESARATVGRHWSRCRPH